MVDNPMWFTKKTPLNDDFKLGYSQAVHQIRLKLSNMDREPVEIRKYTEFMISELQKLPETKETKTTVEWIFEQLKDYTIRSWDDDNYSFKIPKHKMVDLIEKAKEMERDQLMFQYGEGYDEGLYDQMYK